MSQWYYTDAGQQAGPVTAEQLRAIVAAGQVGPYDLVWRQGMLDWQPAAAVPEVAAPAGAYAPPPSAALLPHGQPGRAQLYYAPPPPASHAGMAAAAMICGIVGVLFFQYVLGPLAIILGIVARRKMRASGNLQGRGMATAGIVMGICDLVLLAAAVAFLIVVKRRLH